MLYAISISAVTDGKEWLKLVDYTIDLNSYVSEFMQVCYIENSDFLWYH